MKSAWPKNFAPMLRPPKVGLNSTCRLAILPATSTAFGSRPFVGSRQPALKRCPDCACAVRCAFNAEATAPASVPAKWALGMLLIRRASNQSPTNRPSGEPRIPPNALSILPRNAFLPGIKASEVRPMYWPTGPVPGIRIRNPVSNPVAFITLSPISPDFDKLRRNPTRERSCSPLTMAFLTTSRTCVAS